MAPTLRKLNLTAHIASSVGWVGAIASFLALGITGLTSRDTKTVQSAYIAMNVIDLYIIIPLCLVALITGVIQSLGTEWGIRRYYWLLSKLLLTIGSTMFLLLHQFTAVASAAKLSSEATAGTLPVIGQVGVQLTGDASLAILVLFIMIILSVYKPWGMTRYARRMKSPQLADSETPPGLNIFLTIIAVIVVVGFVLSHLHGHGHHHSL